MLAKQEFQVRVFKVKRSDLVQKLQDNREKHLKDYEEARTAYRNQLLEKVEKAHESAKTKLENTFTALKARYEKASEEELLQNNETIELVSAQTIRMRVPKSYVAAYDTAITAFTWETREEVELTGAELACYIEDKWEWSDDFSGVVRMYKSLQ